MLYLLAQKAAETLTEPTVTDYVQLLSTVGFPAVLATWLIRWFTNKFSQQMDILIKTVETNTVVTRDLSNAITAEQLRSMKDGRGN